MNKKVDVYKMSVEEELEYTKQRLYNSQAELKNVTLSNKCLLERAIKAEEMLFPVKASLDKMTAENSKRLKKEARNKNR